MVNQNTYRQPTPQGWRGRWMRRFGMDTAAAPLTKGELTVPNWVTGKSMVFFFVALLVCWMAFGYVPEFDLLMTACVSVILFFYYSKSLSSSLERNKERVFIKKVFITGLIVRLIWVLYCYYFFNPVHYSNTFGSGADVEWYMPFGEAIALWVRDGFPVSFTQLMDKWGSAIDDVGYPIWLAIIALITDSSSDVFVPFVAKSIMSAYCAVCIYHIAKRHFGVGVARMAAIFVALNPNMIYWCASMMKETEMIFLACLAVDNLDRVLSSGQRYTFKNLLPGMSAGMGLFFFRTALALALFLAVFAHIVMASNRVMSVGKKILAGVLVAATLVVGVGDRFREQAKSMYSIAQSDAQSKNMEWRSERKDGGNSFAKYASAAVFAPLIFTIPFPTFNQAEEGQLVQVQLAGGSYIKNILSFFVIMVMFMLLISGEWRRHVFILAYTVGYLGILVVSAYAQSGRFHMPVMPMLMLFAAYGIQIAKTNVKLRKWFPIVLVAEVVICLAWNWFKLKGRGMI